MTHNSTVKNTTTSTTINSSEENTAGFIAPSDDFTQRTEILLGTPAVEKLKKSRVLVVGIGAVGSFACEALARSGVGHFTLIDSDHASFSNRNRQLVALSSTEGQYKSKIMQARIQDINPGVECLTHEIFVDERNLEALLDNDGQGFDVVVDAIDSVSSKVALLSSCVQLGIPVVSSMGAGGKRNPALIATADISETKVCPLAKKVRTMLKAKRIYKGVPCVYSPEPFYLEQAAPPEEEEQGRMRRPIGTLVTITGSFGLQLAALALNEILDLFDENSTS
jgi:tRNA A37 threonylcarbamoyladenosine dehydratase